MCRCVVRLCCITLLVICCVNPTFAQTQDSKIKASQTQVNPTQAASQTQCALSPLLAYQQIMANTDQNRQRQTSQATTTAKQKPSQSYLTNRIININTATVAELTKLPRIGAKKAQAIVNYRNAHGDFMDIYELTKVKGIGKKTVARFADKVSIR